MREHGIENRNVQTGCGRSSASYPIRLFAQECKAAGDKADQSHPSGVTIKNEWSWISPRRLQGVAFNPLNTKRSLLYLKTQFVPSSKHISSRL